MLMLIAKFYKKFFLENFFLISNFEATYKNFFHNL